MPIRQKHRLTEKRVYKIRRACRRRTSHAVHASLAARSSATRLCLRGTVQHFITLSKQGSPRRYTDEPLLQDATTCLTSLPEHAKPTAHVVWLLWESSTASTFAAISCYCIAQGALAFALGTSSTEESAILKPHVTVPSHASRRSPPWPRELDNAKCLRVIPHRSSPTERDETQS